MDFRMLPLLAVSSEDRLIHKENGSGIFGKSQFQHVVAGKYVKLRVLLQYSIDRQLSAALRYPIVKLQIEPQGRATIPGVNCCNGKAAHVHPDFGLHTDRP